MRPRSSRRRARPENEATGRHRWLLSYADTVTLLFALFLVLFAYAGQNARFQNFTRALSKGLKPAHEAVTAAMASPPPPPEPSQTPPPPPDEDPRARLRSELTNALGKDFNALVELRNEERGLVVAMVDSPLLFPSGQTDVQPRGRELLRRIAVVGRSSGLDLRVEGHTDNEPVHNERYRSNWELSVLRATSVADSLIRAGVPAEKISVMGFGEQRPRESNRTPEGRSANRRVEVVFVVK